MFEAFNELPQSFIERCRYACLVTSFRDGAVHEVHFRLPLGEHILQHAGAMLARGACSLLHQSARIAVKLDAERFCDGFAFVDEIVEELPGGSEARCGTMMQQRERSNRI